MQIDTTQGSKAEAKSPVVPTTTLSLGAIIQKLRDTICNRQLDLNFKCHLLRNLGPLCHNDCSTAEQMSTSLLEKLIDYDQVDFQHVLGSCLTSLWVTRGKLAEQIDTILGIVEKGAGLELNVKRNYVVYLHQIITIEGETNTAIKERLIKLQKIFLKFLFDRRSSMQDLASKSLTIVYNLGDEDTKRNLVEALSNTFSGQTDYKDTSNIKEELEEIKDDELTADFRNQFSDA